jgi:predicted transcriptional regulator
MNNSTTHSGQEQRNEETNMTSVKKQLHQEVDSLPDSCTEEEALYRLYVLHKVRKGRASAKAGQVVPHEQAMQEIDEWLFRSFGPRRRSKI